MSENTQFIITISCLITTIVLGISLTIYNLKILRDTKEQRVATRRAEKKLKNARLKKFYNL